MLGRERVDELAREVKKWLTQQSQEHGIYSPIEQLANSPDFSIFYHAPALVLVTATSQKRQSVQDCCLAGEMLMLAARDAGLASCWIGLSRPWFDLASTKTQLGIPDGYYVTAPIILGHANEWPVSHGRYPAIIHWCPRTQEQRSQRTVSGATAQAVQE